MCIIIYSPDGHIPKKHLKRSLAINKDGWGVAFIQEGKVAICQGMHFSEFFREWKWISKIPGPKLFHARISTQGTITLDNCHPFMIPNHDNVCVAHNGTIQKCYEHGSKESDTRIFVETKLAILPMGFYKNKVILELLDIYIGYSKLVFLDGNGDAYIVNETAGVWEFGNWYSNRTYEPYTTGSYYGNRYHTNYRGSNTQNVMGFAKTGPNEYTCVDNRNKVEDLIKQDWDLLTEKEWMGLKSAIAKDPDVLESVKKEAAERLGCQQDELTEEEIADMAEDLADDVQVGDAFAMSVLPEHYQHKLSKSEFQKKIKEAQKEIDASELAAGEVRDLERRTVGKIMTLQEYRESQENHPCQLPPTNMHNQAWETLA